jgi:sialate O-acetylesterase
MRRRNTPSLALLLALAGAAPGHAEPLGVLPPAGDAMVIQRGVPVPLRGTASPESTVVATFDGARLETRADAAGSWRLDLPARQAGGPHEIEVSSAGETLLLTDVLVGDVWLCSGQSNMEWTLADSEGGEAEIVGAAEAAIRHFKVPRSWSATPEEVLAGGAWEAASPDTAGYFTGVGWFFARALRRHTDVPIGLVNATWGGSRLEAWMPAATLGLDDAGVADVLAAEADFEREVREQIRDRVGELPESDPGMRDGVALWADPELDDGGWETIPVPARWEGVGWEGVDGIAWYRTTFELTESEAAAGAAIALPAVDDSDTTWVNGHAVGRTERRWNAPRHYPVPPEALRSGTNLLTVRVEDTGGGGGIHGDPDLLFVESSGGRTPLAGAWRFTLGSLELNLDDRKRSLPAMVYNQMIRPLEDYPIRGVLWYQGESDTGPKLVPLYRDRFQGLISAWRAAWAPSPAGRDFPFLFAQLASYLPASPHPGDSHWARLREAQAEALVLPATAQVVLTDAGDAGDVHPRDKRVVGERLALAARVLAYGEELVHSGPTYRGHSIRDGAVVLDFDHVGGGLVARDDPHGHVAGFAVAGSDRQFHWAEATIDGDQVLVSSALVPEPVALRYAWADNPEGADLYNREGLPGSPFRTDDWPLEEPPADSEENR